MMTKWDEFLNYVYEVKPYIGIVAGSIVLMGLTILFTWLITWIITKKNIRKYMDQTTRDRFSKLENENRELKSKNKKLQNKYNELNSLITVLSVDIDNFKNRNK
jgi:hypothetical protein